MAQPLLKVKVTLHRVNSGTPIRAELRRKCAVTTTTTPDTVIYIYSPRL